MSEGLNAFMARCKREIWEDLRAGRDPRMGTWDADLLRVARTKEAPQMGATVYHPDHLQLEFQFPDKLGAAVVVSIQVPTPEPVVFMPVPKWVVETIWQGEIDGSYRFQSEAKRLLAEFTAGLEPEANRPWFGPRQATRRE